MRRKLKLYHFLIAVSFLLLALTPWGCEQQRSEEQIEASVVFDVWAHAGQEAERRVLEEQVARFNAQNQNIDVNLNFIPERTYNSQVQAAALAKDLPDILEFDGPYLYNYIWQNQLVPLDKFLPDALIDDLLPSIIDQGTFGNRLYSVGVFDSGLGLYAIESALKKINARIPKSASDAWSVEEFCNILQQLAASDEDKAVLDLKLNYRGEWYTYGFSPILQSAGVDLIERDAYQYSQNVINAQAAISAMQYLQDWIVKGYVDPNLDDAAFLTGRVPISWVGHWEYRRYKAKYKQDLIILPLPDFGQGSRTGQGSWNWGISKTCQHPQIAGQFVAFLLQSEEILAMCNANAAVPGTKSAVGLSELYGPDGEMRLFADQLLQEYSVPRPKTPAYPVITTEFQNAFQQIRNAVSVKEALGIAARNIDLDIRDNRGYPFLPKQ